MRNRFIEEIVTYEFKPNISKLRGLQKGIRNESEFYIFMLFIARVFVFCDLYPVISTLNCLALLSFAMCMRKI